MGEETKTEHTEDKNPQKRSENRKEHCGIIQVSIALEGPQRLSKLLNSLR